MFYKNARIFCADNQFHMGAFEVVDGKFGAILPDTVPEDAVDLQGATVIPGLIDIHSHGNSGHDFSDGDYEGLKKMAQYYLSCGVTSFAPASMTLPYKVLEKAFVNAKQLHEEAPEGCARLMGIQMEGPYFSEKKKGAQNAEYLRLPDFVAFKMLYEASGGLLRIVDIAPELPSAEDFIRKAKELCTVSVAHTDAGYEEAKMAFDAGASHLTHLYNAMQGIHHRNPGPIGAASEQNHVVAELICDGLHVHPSAVRMAFKLFPHRLCLVSDSGRCAGQPDGTEFELGGQMATLIDGVARLADGTIACSATNLWQCMVNAMSFGIPEEDAIIAATILPAQQIGQADKIGAIRTGHYADFVVCDKAYIRQRIFLSGKQI